MQFLHRWVLAALLSLCSVGAFAVTGTLSADGNTSSVTCDGNIAIQAAGTWGSGTLTWYLSDGAAWRAIPGSETTADGSMMLAYPIRVSTTVRGTLAGSTTPSIVWVVRCAAPPPS